MSAQTRCEFLVVRYAPDALKGEFVNIGVVLLPGEAGTAEVRFTRDWRRVRCLDPLADTGMLEAVETELGERLRSGGGDRQRILHLLRDSFANAVQVSEPTGLLTEAPQREMTRLLELYTGRPRPGPPRESAGRTALLQQMRHAFTSAGVWDAMFRSVSVAAYTHPGDPLRMDCGYRFSNTLKLFHAVPLTGEVDSAKVLAFSVPQLRQGVSRKEGWQTEMTAIVESGLSREDPEIAFAMETLREQAIHVAGADRLPEIAELARKEMRI